MTRLPTSGSSVVTPCREESELKHVLFKLCPANTFDDDSVHEHYVKLASLIGGWLSELGRLETSPVKKTLLATAKNLTAAAALFSGLETGLRSDLETEVTRRVQNMMELDPAIGSLASDRLTSFRRDADSISHACLRAAFDLPSGPEKRGRRAKDWYHSFAALLLSIAKDAGISPTLYKDREAESPKGWLLDAARELETFLPTELHSPSDVARYKRLERSNVVRYRRLERSKAARRQNSPSR
jgi:hypothetical protein